MDITFARKVAVGLAALALAQGGIAHAQGWGGWGDRGWGDRGWAGQSWGSYGDRAYGRAYGRDGAFDPRVSAVCSGQRARALEGQLRHEIGEGELDPDEGQRLHAQIDRLEDRGRHECAEGDWGAITRIAGNYERIGQHIAREAHGRWGD